jgi:hypothetical protein
LREVNKLGVRAGDREQRWGVHYASLVEPTFEQSAMWLRFHQYRTDEGWQSMFIPNGEGSVEWKLGWDVDVPPEFCLMVLPWQPRVELEIPMGLLDAKTLQRFGAADGMSIAIRPVAPVRIAREQPIARVVPVHRSALQVDASFEESS